MPKKKSNREKSILIQKLRKYFRDLYLEIIPKRAVLFRVYNSKCSNMLSETYLFNKVNVA